MKTLLTLSFLTLTFSVTAQGPSPRYPTHSPIVGKWRQDGAPAMFQEFTPEGVYRKTEFKDGAVRVFETGNYLLEEDFQLVYIQYTLQEGAYKKDESFTLHYAVQGNYLLMRQVGIPFVTADVRCPPVSCDLKTPLPKNVSAEMIQMASHWRPTPRNLE